MMPALPPLSDAEIQALPGPGKKDVDDEAESALDPSLRTQDKGKGREVEGEEEGAGGVKMKSVAGIYPPPMFSMQRVPWSYKCVSFFTFETSDASGAQVPDPFRSTASEPTRTRRSLPSRAMAMVRWASSTAAKAWSRCASPTRVETRS